jgi:hypothetical protein
MVGSNTRLNGANTPDRLNIKETIAVENIEQIELEAHRSQIIADVKSLVEKYRSIFDWDIPDIDQNRADKLILTAIRDCLDEIERDLS